MKVMRTTVATVVAATLSMSAFSVFAEASLTGAGATFPAPVYAKWADTYQKETGNKVNYQGIGSSGGVKQIIANTVDFGASDAPLSDEKLAQEGKAIVVVSSEMPEIIRISDRVLVMREGKIAAELKGDDINEENIAQYAINDVVNKNKFCN